MENQNDTKLEEWFTAIGAEKFMAVNTLIDNTVDEIGTVTKSEEFLATAEARLLQHAARIITRDEFMNGIREEFEYCAIPKEDTEKIIPILQKFTLNPLFDKQAPSDETTIPVVAQPSQSSLTDRLNQSFTTPTILAPTKRIYTETPSTTASSSSTPSSSIIS